MVVTQMTIYVVTGAKEMDFSLTFTKFHYYIGYLKLSQIALRGLNIGLHMFARTRMCRFLCFFLYIRLGGFT